MSRWESDVRSRMSDGHQTKPPAAGRDIVVIFRHELGYAVGQLVGKSRTRLGGSEADLRVEGERGDASVFGACPRVERGDFCDRAGGDRDHGGCAEAILRLGRGTERSERVRTDDERASCSAEYSLGTVSLPALLNAFEESAFFEGLEVIVQPLAGKAEPAGETGCRIGLGQRREQGPTGALECGGGCLRSLDDFDEAGHGPEDITDNNTCQDKI